MTLIKRLTLFLSAIAAGYMTILLVPNIALMLHSFPDLHDSARRAAFQHWYLGGSLRVLIVSSLLAATSFLFAEGRRTVAWLLAAPVYATLIYAVGVLARLNIM